MQTSSATIVVTDSGLGGLSTAAHLVHRLREEKPFSQARVIYFNAHAASGFGYNEVGAGPRQIQLFDRALEAAGQQDSADYILVACNTLSVLIDQTPYAQSHPTQVVGIVDAGVEAMLAYWERNPDAGLLIFGTPTTIGSGVYQRRLLAAGIPEDQFYPIACPVLHGLIERGPDEEIIYRTIREHIEKGLLHLKAAFRERVAVSLNCTHYGYAKPAFQDGLQQNGVSLGKVISPNASMVSFLFMDSPSYSSCKIQVDVLSQVPIEEEKQTMLGHLVGRKAPELQRALMAYTLDRELFSWRDICLPNDT